MPGDCIVPQGSDPAMGKMNSSLEVPLSSLTAKAAELCFRVDI